MIYINDESRFGAFVANLEVECRRRGEVPLAEIDERAAKEGFRGSAVIDELATTEGFSVDYRRGVLLCR